MKKTLLVLMLVVAGNLSAEPLCDVTLCNRIKRFSLNIWTHIGDSMGEVCFQAIVPKSEAVVNRELDSQSTIGRDLIKGSFNPTKRSVVYIKSINACK